MNRKMIAPIICYHWLGPFLLDTPAHTCENADGQGPTLEAVSRKPLIYLIFGLYIDHETTSFHYRTGVVSFATDGLIDP